MDDGLWENPPYHFDNIFAATQTLFYVALVSGWLDIMDATIAITEVDQQPVPGNHPGFATYYVLFHVCFGFFLLNLFIGVLSSAFSTQSGSNLVTSMQKKWIRALSTMDTYSSVETSVDRPQVTVTHDTHHRLQIDRVR